MTQLAKTSSPNEGQSTEVDEHTEFQSHLPYMGLKLNELSVQEEKFVSLIASGMSIAASGRAVGHSDPSYSYKVAKKEKVQKALDYFREQMREEVHFEIANAHHMYMEAYNASANATEMKNTTDSLVKLHGLSKEEQKPLVNIQINGSKQLERMSDEELLELAGKTIDHLEPKAD